MGNTPDLAAASDFILRTARLLDRFRFAYLFQGGKREAVVSALRPYQNADGGFGNGLEADIRAPISLPIPVMSALDILDEIGAFTDPMVKQACDYLTTITTSNGGVPFVLPSVRPYPRAPWWEPTDNPTGSLNPTAVIAGLLHKNKIDHPWLAPATDFCWRQIDALEATSAYEMRSVLPFLDHVPDRTRAKRAFDRVGPKLLEQNIVTLDPNTPGDIHGPLDFAPRPNSIARPLFTDEVIATNLDAVAAGQRPDGGWMFNFFDWNPATTLEWRGVVTIGALSTLRAYGRLAA